MRRWFFAAAILLLSSSLAVAATPVVNNNTINYALNPNQITINGSGFSPQQGKTPTTPTIPLGANRTTRCA